MQHADQVGTTPTTMAQKTAADIRARITEIDLEIEKIDAEIEQINHAVIGNWRESAKNPLESERAAEDLEKAHRRRKLMQQIREKAAEDLAQAERQIALDRFAEVRGQFLVIMEQRTKRARDVVAHVEMLAAIVQEIYELGEQASALFHIPEQTGLSYTDVAKQVNKVTPQGYIDMILASRLERGLWDSINGQRPGPHFRSDFADDIDRERTSVLAEIGWAVDQAAFGAKTQ